MRTKQDDTKVLAEAYNRVYKATKVITNNFDKIITESSGQNIYKIAAELVLSNIGSEDFSTSVVDDYVQREGGEMYSAQSNLQKAVDIGYDAFNGSLGDRLRQALIDEISKTMGSLRRTPDPYSKV
jgi:hypothetical protein